MVVQLLRWSVLLGGAAFLVGCQSPQEELVSRFLTAVQREDNQTANLYSTRAFPVPVVSWRLGEFSEPTSDPYAVPEMRQAIQDAEHGRDQQFQTYSDFRQSNYGQLSRIQTLQQQSPERPLPARLQELRDEWERQRLERRDKVRQLQEAEIALASEIKRVEKSLQRPSTPEYLTGAVLRSEVEAEVDSGGENRAYRIIIIKYELRNQFDAAVPSRWIITDIQEP